MMNLGNNLFWILSSLIEIFHQLNNNGRYELSRIDDEDLQSIIDSQLKNFESFKIPKSESEKEKELEKLRMEALKVFENQMERTEQNETEETTTVSYDEDENELKPRSIETSTGDDVLIEDLNSRRKK